MSEHDAVERQENQRSEAGESEALPASATAPEASPPKGSSMTRRRALITAGVGAAVLAGGTGGITFLYRRVGRSTARAGALRDYRVEQPDSTPKLVVARGPSVAAKVQAALAKLGGMGKFVARDDVVLVKPNIGWDRTPLQGANTDPELVRVLVQVCLAAGAREVMVTDTPVHEPARTFERSGIAEVARQVGARVLLPSETEQRSVEIPGKLGRWSVMEPLERASKVINVPIAKHHGSTELTAGMKNWMGAVASGRNWLHKGIHESIVGLATLIRPTLTVIDASRVLLRNGPSGGNLDDLKRLDTIAVTLDPVAGDAWAAAELGFDLSKVKYLALAEKAGLGRVDYRSLGPVELVV